MEVRLKSLTDIFILCMLFFLFFSLSKWILLAAYIASYSILYYIDQKRSIHIYVIFSVLFILSFCLFYPDFITIVCMCLCSFILHTIKIEPGKKLITMILLFSIHLLKNPSLHLLVILIALFIFQLIITIMITSRNKIQLSQRMKVMLAMGGGGSILVGIIPYLARGVRYFLSIGIYGLASGLSRGFFEISTTTAVDEKKQERLNKLTSSPIDEEKYRFTEYTTNPYLYSIFIVTFSIIFLVVVIFIVKRRKTLQVEFKNKRLSMSTSLNLASKIVRNKGIRVKQAPPSNIPIRLLVYKFERDMKGIFKRKHGELFRDWLNRIHLNNDELNDQLSNIYEKSRYGEEDIPKNDVKVFKEVLKQIKKRLDKSEE